MLCRPALRSHRNECRCYNPANQSAKFHGFTSVLELSAFIVLSSNPGGGKSGGRSCSCARFCTSISEKSIAGAAAETGTLPLSAPHTPLKTCCWSPVVTILVNAASGVPTISTPRTNSSGFPSAYTLYTSTGSTWNACGNDLVVSVNPP